MRVTTLTCWSCGCVLVARHESEKNSCKCGMTKVEKAIYDKVNNAVVFMHAVGRYSRKDMRTIELDVTREQLEKDFLSGEDKYKYIDA